METDVAALHAKLDLLTAQLSLQNQRLEELENMQNARQDLLLSKLEAMNEFLDGQRQHQAETEALKRDVLPIANHMIKLSIDELAEIGSEFQLEDLLFLIKRLLRDTRLLGDLLNRLESTVELADELQVISNQAFHQAVITLDRLEREGYFTFARSGWRIVERVVTEFDEQDINALGDNIVTILSTVRNLTQPEIMSLTNNALQAIQSTPVENGNNSLWSLLRDLSDPKVRQGLARLLNLVKVLADKPDISNN